MTIKIFTVSKIGTKMPDTFSKMRPYLWLTNWYFKRKKESFHGYAKIYRSNGYQNRLCSFIYITYNTGKKQTDIFIYFLLHKHIRMDYSFWRYHTTYLETIIHWILLDIQNFEWSGSRRLLPSSYIFNKTIQRSCRHNI